MSREKIEALSKKAAESEKSEDALRFSQAASNLAHAMLALRNAEKKVDDE